MLKVLAFLTKREGIDTQAFIDHYEKHHVPFICGLAPTPIVYKRNYLVRGDELNQEDAAIDFDVVTELVFPDRAAYLAWAALIFAPGSGELVVADELKFLERSRTRAYVVEERVTSGC
ncbi:EthD domain-containing protein [Sorangium sp. So ce321]|uniref:EthD domain-containing protein n=1 Tax=Sorangium sp. So ce321 TaxID=3133300 RepID=UPI003F6098AA